LISSFQRALQIRALVRGGHSFGDDIMPNKWMKLGGAMGPTKVVVLLSTAVALVGSIVAILQHSQSLAGIVSQAAAQAAKCGPTAITSGRGGSVLTGMSVDLGPTRVSGEFIVQSCTTGRVWASQGNDQDLLFDIGRAFSVPGYNYAFTPCLLNGGDDLPGAKVTVRYESIDDPAAKATTTFTLADDAEAPELDVHSTPQKGTKVKAGDKIMVRITADETAPVPGHFGWQTGVESIELLADSLHVDGKRYGPVPLPCGRKSWKQTFETTYTVPQNPPPLIRLTARAKDYHPNTATKDAEFPTGDWYGTIKVKGKGNVYDEEGELTFAFSEAPDGTLSGRGHFRRTANRPKPFGTCRFTRRYSADEIDLPITGMREGNQFVLDMNLRTAAAGTVTFGGGCPGGGRAVPTSILAAFTAVASHPRVRAEDGATSTYHYESPGGAASSLIITGSSELHLATQ
jgi:hypothetical protein